MSLKYEILIMFVIAICSRSSAQFCSRSYVRGKWISEGDCGGPEMMSNIMKELEDRASHEKPTENTTQRPTEKIAAKPTENPAAKPTENATVFQRRMKGDVDFYRNWTDYVKGFGNSEGDFWLGLEKLHELTKDGNMELEIDMIRKSDGTCWIAKYRSFRIGPGTDFYKLHVSGFSRNATFDAFAHHNNQQFSTKDAYHDDHPSRNCASVHESGWWYRACAVSNLNGNFNKTYPNGIWWSRSQGRADRLRFSEMKIRRKA